jgi:hypothetical protein
VGPTKLNAFGTNNHNYSRIDITPLYIGQMKTSDIVYRYFFNLFKKVVRIGGLLESFAFATVGIYVYVYVYVCTYIYMYIHMYIYMHIYMYIYMYIYIYEYVHTHKFFLLLSQICIYSHRYISIYS